MVFNRIRQKYSFQFRAIVWSLAILFPIGFGFATTVDGGVFMAIVSLLVALVVTEVLFNNVTVRAQGGGEDSASSDMAGDEIA